jgi:GT2 family glycosyltransferase
VDLSIIIVNWNSKDFVRKCAQSIRENPPEMSYEIIVVDGASFDGCGEMLAKEFPEVRFVQSQKNVGFAKANNLGFEKSNGELLLFLNPDTEVRGGAVNTLVAALRSLDKAGIAGAKLLNTDGSVQTSCVQPFPTILNQLLDSENLRRAFPRHSFWGMAALFEKDPAPKEVEVLSGACLLMKRETFQAIGLFSQNYFMYAEDLDLCYKVRQAGLKNYYVPAAEVVHHGGGSTQAGKSTFSAVMMRESVYRFLVKVRGWWYGQGFRASLALGAVGRLLALVLVFPVRLALGEASGAANSIRKWLAILKWTLGMQTWVAKYG